MKATILPTVALAIALSSCENPADKTTSAEVGKAETVTTSTAGTRYTLTENSKIGFTGSKVTGSHSGGFSKFTGTFTLNPEDPAKSSGRVEIDMDSTWSDNDKLTTHLKNDDFFDVTEHPTTVFELTSLEKTSDTAYQVSGNLTLRGQTKNITFPATAADNGGSVAITSTFDINRRNFGIVHPGKQDDLIRDEVVIRLELEATPAN